MACFSGVSDFQMQELVCDEGVMLERVGSLTVQRRALSCLALFSLHCPSETQFSLPSFYPCALCCVTPEFLELQPVFTRCLCSVCSYRDVNWLPKCPCGARSAASLASSSALRALRRLHQQPGCAQLLYDSNLNE